MIFDFLILKLFMDIAIQVYDESKRSLNSNNFQHFTVVYLNGDRKCSESSIKPDSLIKNTDLWLVNADWGLIQGACDHRNQPNSINHTERKG